MQPLRTKDWDRALVEYTAAMLLDEDSKTKPSLSQRLHEISCPGDVTYPINVNLHLFLFFYFTSQPLSINTRSGIIGSKLREMQDILEWLCVESVVVAMNRLTGLSFC